MLLKDEQPSEDVLQLGDTIIGAFAAFEALGNAVKPVTCLVQHQFFPIRGYKQVLRSELQKMLGPDAIANVIKTDCPGTGAKPLRKDVKVSALGELGKEAYKRALDEAKLRAGIASGTGLSAMDCVAFLLDLRLLCFFEEYFPDESERDAAVQHLREWHRAYHLQCQYYEFEHGCPDGLLSVLYSTPASSRAASAGLDRFRRTSTLTAQASSAAPPEATTNVFDEALANAQEEADWENWWPQWRQYSRDVEWRYVFPGFEKWKDLGPEERPHVVRHLIELPYLDHLIDLVDQKQFGMFALLGIQCCGSHLASAFSERVNSAGGRVVTLDRLSLGGRSVELETQLKINNSAREFFHQEFKAEYASATDAAPVISAFRQLTKADVEERFAGELEDSD